MEYGDSYEGEALKSLENSLGWKMRPCGLFMHSKLQYLAATPDGLVDDGIVEGQRFLACKDVKKVGTFLLQLFIARTYGSKISQISADAKPGFDSGSTGNF
ncbi:hypothetical protein TNCT_393451 [Trichonephila clavata]|uniref:Uncharacterized protein n=1 Tax=Trichonephila clavata TaxID=2740835 RepID=A0A8X6L6A3_TRICU|nr:hypothetical protein TNCT_393451 [Trichonephila clavata]